MGLFDLFDEANEQFCKDVRKAWDELWDNDTSADNDDRDDENIIGIGDLFPSKPWMPVPDGAGNRNTLKELSNLIGGVARNPLQKILQTHSEPAPGTPVYCKLAVVAEHTGIYIGNDEIVHLNGDGDIEIVSPGEFVARWDGLNPAVSIYYAAKSNGTPLCRKSIANRARSMVGGRRDYSMFFDNCHQFTSGCISGDFENPCNFFWMVEMEIRDKLGLLTWVEWDF